MRDLVDSLPRSEARLVRNMAAAADCSPDEMALEMVRGYLGLVRSAPAAIPQSPLRALASSAIRKAV